MTWSATRIVALMASGSVCVLGTIESVIVAVL
jgi:hypothetical protein